MNWKVVPREQTVMGPEMGIKAVGPDGRAIIREKGANDWDV